MLAPAAVCRYAGPVAAKSVTGIDSPFELRRTRAAIGAFFYGRFQWWPCVGSRKACRFPRFPVCQPAYGHRLSIDSEDGDSNQPRSHTMTTLSPRAIRARAHRRMAFAALWSQSSASVRLKRYRAHMDRARAIEAAEKPEVRS